MRRNGPPLRCGGESDSWLGCVGAICRHRSDTCRGHHGPHGPRPPFFIGCAAKTWSWRADAAIADFSRICAVAQRDYQLMPDHGRLGTRNLVGGPGFEPGPSRSRITRRSVQTSRLCVVQSDSPGRHARTVQICTSPQPDFDKKYYNRDRGTQDCRNPTKSRSQKVRE